MIKFNKCFWGIVIISITLLLFSSLSLAVDMWPGQGQSITSTCTIDTSGVISEYCEPFIFNGQSFPVVTARFRDCNTYPTDCSSNGNSWACSCIFGSNGPSFNLGYQNPTYGETGYLSSNNYIPLYYGTPGVVDNGYMVLDAGGGYCYYGKAEPLGLFETQINEGVYSTQGKSKLFTAVGFCPDSFPTGGGTTKLCIDSDFNTSNSYGILSDSNVYFNIPDLLTESSTYYKDTTNNLEIISPDTCNGPRHIYEYACYIYSSDVQSVQFFQTSTNPDVYYNIVPIIEPSAGSGLDCDCVNSSGYYAIYEDPLLCGTGAVCTSGACACPTGLTWQPNGKCGCELDPYSKQFKIVKNDQTVAGIDKNGNLKMKGEIFQNSNPDAATGKTFKIKGSAYSCGTSSWTVQLNQPGAGILTSVSFLDANYGLAAGMGSGGKIFRTTNAGSTWTDVSGSIPGSMIFYDVSYPTSTYAYAVGQSAYIDGKIYSSSSGGASWALQKTVTNMDFRGVAFKDSSTGFVVGGNSNKAIYFTNNKGVTWTADTLPAIPAEGGNNGGKLNSVTWAGNNMVFAVGNYGSVFYNNNPTAIGNWQAIGWGSYTGNLGVSILGTTGLSADEHLTGVYFTDETNGWIVGYNGLDPSIGIILRTNSGGDYWEKQIYSTSNRRLEKVYFSDVNNGIIVGTGNDGPIVIETTDGGLTWREITGNILSASDVSYKGGSQPTVVGSNNYIAKKDVGSVCTTVAAFDSSGNLYLKGTFTSGASNVTPIPGTNNFIIKSNGDNKLMIDKNGNLITKGWVNTNNVACAVTITPPLSPTLAPSEPLNLHSSWVIKLYNGATNHVMWNPPVSGPVTKYLLEKKVDNGNWVQIYDSSDPLYGAISDLEFYDSFYNNALAYGSDHYYRVRAQNDDGIGPYSSTLTSTLDCPTTCADLIGSYYTCGTVGLTTGFCPTINCGTCSSPSSCSDTPYYTCVGGGGGGGGGDCPQECGGSYDCNSDSECANLYGDGSYCACQDCNGDWGTGSIYRCNPNVPQPGSLCFACGSLPCFPANTTISLANGSYSPIQNIKVGDKIIAWDEDTNQKSTAIIQKVLIHEINSKEDLYKLDKITFSSGDSFEATPNHPVYVIGKGWIEVNALEIGDTVYKTLSNDMQEVYVVDIIRDYSKDSIVYNLQTTKHDYFANDILVHNKCVIGSTLIELKDGSMITINKVKPGDEIMTLSKGKKISTVVTHVFQKSWNGVLKGYTINLAENYSTGYSITSTANHIFETESGKKSAGELFVGETLITDSGKNKILGIKETTLKEDYIWDLRTEEGSYLANGILVLES